ncbi:MAG: SDR family oxidoreductase [Aquabacterium sp.]|uniref:SDR family oxidoreductase n=1 Tax=Aquabacterium sp. TaxID=1872578 RepID=UPI0012242C72|nr:SDR family oxidoreductase [Aquabacterium sp.]TAK83393.1 MAG: SDR family oxidoreductase [Aquabacterium sp.]
MIGYEFMKLEPESCLAHLHSTPINVDRYLICTGYLAGKSIDEIRSDHLAETFSRNFAEIARFCDKVFAIRPEARVCIIGSESGFAGSYDMAYAGAKAAIHLYIETKRLKYAEQMIVGIAPGIIWDSNMTQSRDDRELLSDVSDHNRLGRWISAKEVAELAHYLLMEASPAVSGQIIRMRP